MTALVTHKEPVLDVPHDATGSYPTHLTCPYCPAQAYPGLSWTEKDQPLRVYVCPQKHKFYIHPEKK